MFYAYSTRADKVCEKPPRKSKTKVESDVKDLGGQPPLMKLSEKSKPELPARKDPKHKESKTSAQSDERKKLDKQSSIEEIEKRVKKSSLLSSVRYKIYF